MTISSRASDVLYAIYVMEQLQGATRRSISSFVDASMVVVSKALGELERDNLIEKTPMSQDWGGRPTFSYSVCAGGFSSVGIALQKDRAIGVLVDSDKQIRARVSEPVTWGETEAGTADTVLSAVQDLLAQLTREEPTAPNPVAVGLSLPGLVDSRSGVWVRGLQVPGVSRLNITEILKPLGLPIQAEDYTRTLAFYEMTMGNGRDVRDFVLMNLGLGVGSSIVIDRKIYRGTHGLAGEIGHITVNPNGRRCTCGMVGCLETVCSVPNILHSVRQLSLAGVITNLNTETDALNLETIKRALNDGDRLVQTVISEASEALLTGLETLTKVVNPSHIVVTGPGAVLFSPTRTVLENELRLKILPEMEQDLELRFSDYQDSQEAWGAALLAIDRAWPFAGAEEE